MQLCTLDTIHHGTLNMIETKLRTLPIALDGTLPACLTVPFQASSQDALNRTPKHTLNNTPNCTQCHIPSLLEYTFHCKLWRGSQEHSEYTPTFTFKYIIKYTPEHALEHTPTCTWWHTHRMLGSMLSSTLWRSQTIPIWMDYRLSWMLLGVRSRDLMSSNHQEQERGWHVASGRWPVVDGGHNDDIGRYQSLNLIFSMPTMTRFPNTVSLQCWQLQL